MNAKKLLTGFVLADFIALHVYALETQGLQGFVTYLQNLGGWSLVLGVDLIIALTMVGIWLYQDARTQGRAALPYLMLMPLGGSMGPLLYLLRSSSKARAPS